MGNLFPIIDQIQYGTIEDKIQKNDKKYLDSLRKYKFTSEELLWIIDTNKHFNTFKFIIDECEYDSKGILTLDVFNNATLEMLKYLKEKSYDFSNFRLESIKYDLLSEERIRFLVEECNVPITRKFLNIMVIFKEITILKYIKSRGVSYINITSDSINRINEDPSHYKEIIEFIINEYDMDPKLFLKNNTNEK